MPTLTFTDTCAASSLAAGRWFLQSGIQEPDGGVARYHLLADGRNLPVSNEITGYAVSTLVALARMTGQEEYLTAAERAARLLTRTAWQRATGVLPFENGHDSPAYFFDCGIVVRGLLALWRETRGDELLDVASGVGRFMLRAFDAGGFRYPIVSLPSGEPWPMSERWSRGPGCYQLKSALAWQELAHLNGDREFADAYETVRRYSLDTYPAFLPGTDDKCAVMDRLHAFCYFLEGLLPTAGEQSTQAAWREGIRLVSEYQRLIAPEFLRSDVVAQLLRARLLAAAAGAVTLDEEAAAAECEAIAGFQSAEGGPMRSGGYFFGRKAGRMLPFMNPVSTAFCWQARSWYALQSHGQALPLSELI